MDDAPYFLHMDSDYFWRWYITDVEGKMVAVSRPYFGKAEAEQAMRILAMPLAA